MFAFGTVIDIETSMSMPMVCVHQYTQYWCWHKYIVYMKSGGKSAVM